MVFSGFEIHGRCDQILDSQFFNHRTHDEFRRSRCNEVIFPARFEIEFLDAAFVFLPEIRKHFLRLIKVGQKRKHMLLEFLLVLPKEKHRLKRKARSSVYHDLFGNIRDVSGIAYAFCGESESNGL